MNPNAHGQAQNDHEHGVDRHGTLAIDTPLIHGKADQILEHSDNGGKRREAHEHEEQRAPDVAERHLAEHYGKRDEHERRTGIGRDVVCKACREDDQARQDGDERVEQRDVDGLAREAALRPIYEPKISIAAMPSESEKNACPIAA